MSNEKDESSEELLNQEDQQVMEEVVSPDTAFNNISIPAYMVRRFVRELGLARKKKMEGGLGFDGQAYTALALSYSFIMTKLLAAAKEIMKEDGRSKLTNQHLLGALAASPDIKRLLPNVYIGGVGVIPEDTLVRIKNTRVGGAVLEHTLKVHKNRADKANGAGEGDPDLADVEMKDADDDDSSSSESDEEAKKAEEEAEKLEKAKEKKKLLKEKLKQQKEEKEKTKEKAKKKDKKRGRKAKKDEDEEEEEKKEESESVADRAKNRRKRKAEEALETIQEEPGRRQSKKARTVKA